MTAFLLGVVQFAVPIHAGDTAARALEAHTHHVVAQSRAMISIFLGALVVAGLLTLLHGRIMHAVVFGHRHRCHETASAIALEVRWRCRKGPAEMRFGGPSLQ